MRKIMKDKVNQTVTIPESAAGLRFDQALSRLLPDHSRTQIQDWIKKQEVTLDGEIPTNKTIVIGGEIIVINATIKQPHQYTAEAIALDIIYEDEALLIINKPAGMVVHPGAGHFTSTLLNALLHHVPDLKDLPRAGIIHRLDKDTTGLLVIAKTQAALLNLTNQMKERTVTRIYQAVVCGIFISGGKVDEPIGRHPMQRKRMAVMDNGKPAVTHYRIMERYRAHTRLKIQLETGRTHQIRVHMAHVKHPVLGDPVYAGRLQLPKGATPELVTMLRGFKRQALHAFELGLVHPVTGDTMTWRAPIPDDMKNLVECLRVDTPKDNDHYDN
jgi:23S rRNA pseudouridine1911/1915/1917 synthase